MSDFGSIIYIKAQNGAAISPAFIAELEAAIANFAAETTLKGSLGSKYLFSRGQVRSLNDPQIRELTLLLSDHWGDAQDFDFHREVELRDSRKVAAHFRKLFPGYDFNPEFSWW